MATTIEKLLKRWAAVRLMAEDEAAGASARAQAKMNLDKMTAALRAAGVTDPEAEYSKLQAAESRKLGQQARQGSSGQKKPSSGVAPFLRGVFSMLNVDPDSPGVGAVVGEMAEQLLTGHSVDGMDAASTFIEAQFAPIEVGLKLDGPNVAITITGPADVLQKLAKTPATLGKVVCSKLPEAF